MTRLISSLFAGLALVICASFVPANTYKIGDAVADFSLKNVDGKMVSMADYKNAKGFIIVFTCNHCPFAKRYQSRVNDLSKKYVSKNFPLIAISPNDVEAVPEDSFDEMVKRAKDEHYTYPYLLDNTQDIARVFNATKTPHAFVVFKENGKLILKYAGAIDDNGGEAEKAKVHYVEDAVDALLAGKPVAVTTTKSVGCGIKWKNK